MADYRHDLQFGIFVTPAADQAGAALELARLADVVGLGLVTFQDHPQPGEVPRRLDAAVGRRSSSTAPTTPFTGASGAPAGA